MQQLTAADTSFLSMETGSVTGHVGSLSLFGPDATYEAVKARIEERIHLLPPYRRRLVEVPMGLDLPYWIEAPDFDLEFHVREIAVPSPGTREQLADLIARVAARPMDRSRPLWEWYVIEGIEGGAYIGHYAKTHHATIDGASGTELMTILLDDSPVPSTGAEVPPPWQGERIPSTVELLGRTAVNLARSPRQQLRAQVRLLRELQRNSRNPAVRRALDQTVRQISQPIPGPVGDYLRRQGRRADGDTNPAPPIAPVTAPRTPFNASITPHRRWSYCTVSLAEMKRVKSHFGVTLNDVVLAVCAGALRRYLQDHDALPTEPLLAMCPVSIRTGEETDTYTNRVSGMTVPLATDIADPVERLEAINRATVVAKEQLKALPADVLQDFGRFAPPAVAAMASRVMSRLRIADRVSPPFNLIISNVPGPRHPLYLAGSQLEHIYPVSAIGDGMGLNMTVISYLDHLDFGIISCRELLPDLWTLNDHLPDAVAELVAAVKE
jgi:WS/DGAT/MGAT family acyltransferase